MVPTLVEKFLWRTLDEAGRVTSENVGEAMKLAILMSYKYSYGWVIAPKRARRNIEKRVAIIWGKLKLKVGRMINGII